MLMKLSLGVRTKLHFYRKINVFCKIDPQELNLNIILRATLMHVDLPKYFCHSYSVTVLNIWCAKKLVKLSPF
jgi:hypothetical protein